MFFFFFYFCAVHLSALSLLFTLSQHSLYFFQPPPPSIHPSIHKQQPRYSSPHAPCRGKNPEPPKPETLPLVPVGSVCGEYVARCATGCCNQLNYCEPEADMVTGQPSFACQLYSCSLVASPNSTLCKDVSRFFFFLVSGLLFCSLSLFSPLFFSLSRDLFFPPSFFPSLFKNKQKTNNDAKVHARAQPVTRRFKFTATWGKAAPDGYEVDAVLVNGQYPAPTIYANAGDRIIVQFVNLLGRPSTIHWHGIKQASCFFFSKKKLFLFVVSPSRASKCNSNIFLFSLFLSFFSLSFLSLSTLPTGQHRLSGRSRNGQPGGSARSHGREEAALGKADRQGFRGSSASGRCCYDKRHHGGGRSFRHHRPPAAGLHLRLCAGLGRKLLVSRSLLPRAPSFRSPRGSDDVRRGLLLCALAGGVARPGLNCGSSRHSDAHLRFKFLFSPPSSFSLSPPLRSLVTTGTTTIHSN